MPIFKKLTSLPPANSGAVGKRGKFKSQNKKPVTSRKRPVNEPIYGEELFASNIKKEREIVIGFHPFTENNLRISKDGKFIIERVMQPEGSEDFYWWNLFYFENPLTDFSPKSDVEIPHMTYTIDNNSCQKYPDFPSVQMLADRVITLVRIEFMEDRKKKLAELIEQDKLDKTEKEAAELLAEQEAENEQREINGDQKSTSDSENNIESAKDDSSEAILSQENQEISDKNIQNEEDNKPRGIVFKKI